MDLALTKEQEELAKKFAKICADVIAPAAADTDRNGNVPAGNFTALAEAGYFGLGIPAQEGGAGGDMLSAMLAEEEVAMACPSTFLSAASTRLLAQAIGRFGESRLKTELLGKLASGKIAGAVALSEESGGIDPENIFTEFQARGSDFVLKGSKAFVTNGPFAQAVAVVAKNAQDASDIRWFVVLSDNHGFSAGTPVETMGLRGAKISSIALEDCVVPAWAKLSSAGKPMEIHDTILKIARLHTAILCVGIAKACREFSIDYAMTRRIGGKKIARHQEVHFKIAQMQIDIEGARQVALKLAWSLDAKEKCLNLAEITKLYASEIATRCAHAAVQIFGGKGFLAGSPVERLYRDSRYGEIGWGTSEMLRVKIAHNVLDLY